MEKCERPAESKEHAHARRDPLASVKFKVWREDVPVEAGQCHECQQHVARCAGIHNGGAGPVSKCGDDPAPNKDPQNALEAVKQQRERRDLGTGDAKRVGCTDIARAGLTDIDVTGEPADDEAEGNTANQVANSHAHNRDYNGRYRSIHGRD